MYPDLKRYNVLCLLTLLFRELRYLQRRAQRQAAFMVPYRETATFSKFDTRKEIKGRGEFEY